MFGGGIDRLPLDGLVAGNRAGDDDIARAPGDHAGQHSADQAEDAADIDLHQLIPGVGIAIGHVAGDIEASIG
ncbi:hypothetical protein D3C72_2491240 [compost metagenome]